MARPYKRSGGTSRRRFSAAKAVVAKARQSMYAKNRAAPGFTRTSGFYGRFSGKAGELKFNDETGPNFTIPTTGSIWGAFCSIPQGTGESQRIGRKATFKKFLLKGTLNIATTTHASHCHDSVRLMLVQDTQANGTLPNVGDILDGPNIRSFNNLENSNRFRTLADKMFHINTTAATASRAAYTEDPGTAAAPNGGGYTNPAMIEEYGGNDKQISLYKDFQIPVEWSGSTGATAEIRSNNILLVAISQRGVASLEFESRTRYLDN